MRYHGRASFSLCVTEFLVTHGSIVNSIRRSAFGPHLAESWLANNTKHNALPAHLCKPLQVRFWLGVTPKNLHLWLTAYARIHPHASTFRTKGPEGSSRRIQPEPTPCVGLGRGMSACRRIGLYTRILGWLKPKDSAWRFLAKFLTWECQFPPQTFRDKGI